MARSPISWNAAAVIVAAIVAIVTAGQRIGDRPTRAEVNARVEISQKQIQRELDEIKKRQYDVIKELRDLNRALGKVLP